MLRQRDLFRSMCAEVHARQADLWDLDGPAESPLSCGECGEPMVQTPSGYICCPRGHGKLRAAVQEQPDDEAPGLWAE